MGEYLTIKIEDGDMVTINGEPYVVKIKDFDSARNNEAVLTHLMSGDQMNIVVLERVV